MKRQFIVCLACSLITTIGWSDEKVFVYDDHGRRDPFWSLVNPGGTIVTYETDFVITDLTLEGISVGASGDNIAIINGRVVKTNDTIGQFVVSKINKDSVILTKGQEKFELKL